MKHRLHHPAAALARLATATLAAVATLLPAPAGRAAERELNLYIWVDYMDPDVLSDFRRETGIRVNESNFASNEELLAKIQTGTSQYDVITPSDYMVRIMIREKLLAPLDAARLPAADSFAPQVRETPFDPGHVYSVPYNFGTTGIAYNRTKVRPAPTGWADLLDPEKVARYKGRISLLDDPREVLGAYLLLDGRSMNETDAGAIAAAGNRLRALLPLVAKFDSSAYKDSLVSGETWLAMGWSQDIALAAAENPDIEFVIPAEGSTFYMDTCAIPAKSPRRAEAMELIAFLLRPEISARIANYIQGPSPIAAARADIDEAILNGIPYRTAPDGKRFPIEDLGDAEETYSDVWTRVKGE